MEYDLVFEGGGAKGLVFVGALQVLAEHGHTIGRVIGTSAGAITAALVAAGYDGSQTLQAANEKLPNGKARFSSFMDAPASFAESEILDSLSYRLLGEVDFPGIPDFVERHVDRIIIDALMQSDKYRHLFSFVELGGWYSGAAFLAWLQEKLDADGRNLGKATLAEFHEQTRRDLSVVGSDISGKEMLVLNHRTAPGCPVAWAVRMSMSVPFAWQEVTWRAEWGGYRSRDISGHKIVDGGLLSNFPIGLLVSRDPEVLELMGEAPNSGNVLGLLIDEAVPVPGAGEAPKPAAQPGVLSRLDLKELEITQRISNMADTLISARDKSIIDAYQKLVCRLPAGGYGTLEFDMSEQRIQAIINAGRNALEDYFKAS